MTKATCRYVGIDIGTWLAEDLVDLLVTADDYSAFTMPTEELTELGHAHGVPVYPTISGSGVWEPLCWRGAASNAWASHADGIYLFNIRSTVPDHWAFTTLGDKTTLATMDKMFAIDTNSGLMGYRQGNAQGSWVLQRLPIALDSCDKSRQVTLPVGDDIAGAAKAGTLMGAALRIRFGGTVPFGGIAPDDLVEVRLNGESIAATGPVGDHTWVSYGVDPAKWLRGDNNVFSFRLTSRGAGRKGEITVEAVELNVTYK